MIFFPGLHQPGDARHFERACVSVSRLKTRVKPLGCPSVLIDSGAFSELSIHGAYREPVAAYATTLYKLYSSGVARIVAAVAQDYMCEPFILKKTGLDVETHQALTIRRYDALVRQGLPFPIMPVIQGFAVDDYVDHVRAYGARLAHGAWVGVGSVCKRQGKPETIVAILEAIRSVRPDINLHGFGVKHTAVASAAVRNLLHSADSMAWSWAARWERGTQNDWREAMAYARKIDAMTQPGYG